MSENSNKGSLLVIFLTVFIDLLGFGIVLPLVPIYADAFSEDPSGVVLGLLMASFSVMQFFFAPVWGKVSDHAGRRPVILLGLAGSVVFYTLFGIATRLQSLPLLFISRIGAGIAGATIPTAQAYIADSTSLEKRPQGMALIGMAFGLGFTFGPLVAFLAVPSGHGDPGPWPGYVAALLSALALVLAFFRLPESLRPGQATAARRLLDLAAFGRSLRTPSIGLLLLVVFVCVFSFAAYETTLSLLMKGSEELAASPFRFTFRQVCLTYAYIGLMLALVQGVIVRRLAGRVSESRLSIAGGLLEMAGYAAMVGAIRLASVPLMLAAAAAVVGGFSMMHPSLNSLISRRTDPATQGTVMGVAQSISSMARILGAGLGIPLLVRHLAVPYWAAAGLMAVGVLVLAAAARRGEDYPVSGSAD